MHGHHPLRGLRAIVLVAALSVALPSAAQEVARKPSPDPGVHPDAIGLIDAWLESEQQYHRLPSLVVSIMKGDRVVFTRGYGSVDPAGKIPATPDTIYSICSISKLFTSIAVMQLFEQGKVALDDEVTKYLPEFRLAQADSASGPVTIRSLLMHSGGVPREAVGDYWTAPEYRFPAREEMLSGLTKQEMYDRSLSRYQYSNLGMALLGEIVERVSGTPYDRYVVRNILEPLGMRNTLPRIPDELRGERLAVGHGALRRDGTRQVLGAFDTRGLLPAAGFSSTVHDLSLFALWQLRLLRSGKTEVLRPWTLREMQRIQWTDTDGKTLWGLGFGISRVGSDLVAGHLGRCPGYRASQSVVPAKEIGIVTALSSMENPSLFARPILALMQKTPTGGAAKPGVALADYVGRYSFQPWSDETMVLPWGSDLVSLTVPSTNPAEDMRVLRHVGPEAFREVREDRTLGEVYTFLRDESGRVRRLRIWGTTGSRTP